MQPGGPGQQSSLVLIATHPSSYVLALTQDGRQNIGFPDTIESYSPDRDAVGYLRDHAGERDGFVL
jgi:hypothetical protein